MDPLLLRPARCPRGGRGRAEGGDSSVQRPREGGLAAAFGDLAGGKRRGGRDGSVRLRGCGRLHPRTVEGVRDLGGGRVTAFVKTGYRPGEAGIKDVPVTDPGAGEVLLRVASCGICGSDVHAFRSDAGFEWVRTPVTLGHEFSGIVEA